MNEKEPQQLCKDPEYSPACALIGCALYHSYVTQMSYGISATGEKKRTDFASQEQKNAKIKTIVDFGRQIDCPNILSPEESEALGTAFRNPDTQA